MDNILHLNVQSVCIMFVQCFEPWGSCFTNLHYHHCLKNWSMETACTLPFLSPCITWRKNGCEHAISALWSFRRCQNKHTSGTKGHSQRSLTCMLELRRVHPITNWAQNGNRRSPESRMLKLTTTCLVWWQNTSLSTTEDQVTYNCYWQLCGPAQSRGCNR